MRKEIQVFRYSGGNEKEILELVRRVFLEFCSSDCDQFGLKVFNDFIEEYNFIERNKTNSVAFYAKYNEAIIGMVEMRDNNHICLLFVDKHYHGKGVARKLMQEVTQLARLNKSKQIDVNASLYSVAIYEKLGFRKTEEIKEVNGIKFYPMVLDI